jgi:hypothetical protein
VDHWSRLVKTLLNNQKPAILHALILHYISTEQYRLALDELDT